MSDTVTTTEYTDAASVAQRVSVTDKGLLDRFYGPATRSLLGNMRRHLEDNTHGWGVYNHYILARAALDETASIVYPDRRDQPHLFAPHQGVEQAVRISPTETNFFNFVRGGNFSLVPFTPPPAPPKGAAAAGGVPITSVSEGPLGIAPSDDTAGLLALPNATPAVADAAAPPPSVAEASSPTEAIATPNLPAQNNVVGPTAISAATSSPLATGASGDANADDADRATADPSGEDTSPPSAAPSLAPELPPPPTTTPPAPPTAPDKLTQLTSYLAQLDEEQARLDAEYRAEERQREARAAQLAAEKLRTQQIAAKYQAQAQLQGELEAELTQLAADNARDEELGLVIAQLEQELAAVEAQLATLPQPPDDEQVARSPLLQMLVRGQMQPTTPAPPPDAYSPVTQAATLPTEAGAALGTDTVAQPTLPPAPAYSPPTATDTMTTPPRPPVAPNYPMFAAAGHPAPAIAPSATVRQPLGHGQRVGLMVLGVLCILALAYGLYLAQHGQQLIDQQKSEATSLDIDTPTPLTVQLAAASTLPKPTASAPPATSSPAASATPAPLPVVAVDSSHLTPTPTAPIAANRVSVDDVLPAPTETAADESSDQPSPRTRPGGLAAPEPTGNPTPVPATHATHLSYQRLGIDTALVTVGKVPAKDKKGKPILALDGTPKTIWQTDPKRGSLHRDSQPCGSNSGNTIVNGHNWGDGTGVFANLPKAAAGDIITCQNADGSSFQYKVISVKSLPYDDNSALYQTSDPRLTLVTCTNDGSLRVTVIAQLEGATR